MAVAEATLASDRSAMTAGALLEEARCFLEGMETAPVVTRA
jgi:hypothetical protein